MVLRKSSDNKKLPRIKPDTEELKVYTKVVHVLLSELNPDIKLIIISESINDGSLRVDMSMDYILKGIKKSNSELSKETTDDFKKKNKEKQLFAKSLNFDFDYKTISDYELNEIFKNKDGWRIFHNKYPSSSGIIWLSRIGFDHKQKQAFVYIGNQRGSLSGIGYYMLLEKKNIHWLIKERMLSWIS